MAKFGITLSNGDGKKTYTPTSSVNYDDATQYLTINDISASNFTLSGANSAILAVSGGSVVAYNASAYSGAYMVTNGATFNALSNVTLSVGTVGGDLSGSYPDPVYKNISNISAGSLKIANGGLSGSGQNNILNSIPSGSLIIANNTSTIAAVSTASYNGSGDWVLGAINNGTTWGAITASAVVRDQNLQYFTCSLLGTTSIQTWTKQNSAHKWARVMLQAGGGGGGGNSVFPAGANASGGGGGGFTDIVLYLGSVSSAIITVGAGGAGSAGPARASRGTSSSFSATNIFVSAQGGNGGIYNSGPTAADGGFGLTFEGGGGGIATNSAATSTAGSPSGGASGGGAGAVTGGTQKAGGTAAAYTLDTAGTINAGTSGINLFGYSVPFNFGTGGGGGALSAGGTNGVFGGGGGGAAKQSSAGAVQGGTGGDGFVVVLSY